MPLPPRGDLDPPAPDPDQLRRYGAVLLDPTTATRFDGQRLRGTAYVIDRLLVPHSLLGAVAEVLSRLHLTLTYDVHDDVSAARLQGLVDLPVSVTLHRTGPAPQPPPDAWEVLQQLRAAGSPTRKGDRAARSEPGGPDRDVERFGEFGRIGLVHLITAMPPSVGPHPIGPPTASGGQTTGYVLNGFTRLPVTLEVPTPVQMPIDPVIARRPVVAVFDTGCGRHPWLPAAEPAIIERTAHWSPPIGYTDAETDPERHPDQVGGLDGVLDWASGHGTFIAGLIRQKCPDATVLAVRVCASDGAIVEDYLIHSLGKLLARLSDYQLGEGDGGPVDVVVLSLGYYHETPEDSLADAPLRSMLDAYNRLGVTVVTAAGNESTSRPSYPAFFAPHDGNPVPTGVPTVVSVGALNPDDTIALFSNSGPPDGALVTAWRRGAFVISTFPVSFEGGLSPDDEAPDPSDGVRLRTDIDPDAYRSGFGLWSGTSFAAPIVAGEIVAALFDAAGSAGSALLAGDGDPVPRSFEALTRVVGTLP